MSRAELLRARAAAASAAVLAYGVCLLSTGWPRDDRGLILENPLLRAGLPAAGRLLTSGLFTPMLGAGTPVHEWRPVLALTFLVQRLLTGFSPWPLHAVNLALHALVSVLVFEVLRRRMEPRAAAAGALVFAVLPVHAETVAYLTSRSELLAAAFVLPAWLLLGAPEKPSTRRAAAGAALYLAGSLSKEHALLFPLLLALSDWTFAGRLPWEPERRRVYLALGAAAALVLLGRALVLPAIAAGGVPYFRDASPLSRLLTLAKFWTWWYVRPALTGAGLCTDFARPFIPDSTPADGAAWIALLAVVSAAAAAGRAVALRKSWGFWLLGPCLFLLPTSHLLMNLDSIGAQRFLYLPCLAVAAGAAALFRLAEKKNPRAARAALAAAVLALGLRAAARAADWRDDIAYYRAASSCNPLSAKARAGLGLSLIRAGREGEGAEFLRDASALDPRLFDPVMNLALLAYRRGDFDGAGAGVARALALDPDAPDALTLRALLDERRGDWPAAAAALARAVASRPDDPVARFDLARALAALGRPEEAAAQLAECARLSPDAPSREEANAWRERLLAQSRRKR